MCGFLICSGVNNSLPCYEDFAAALRLQRHRGPDDSLIIDSGNVRMGFNRLSIIDFSPAAMQPIRHGPVTLMLNGEIYNYIELRRELRKAGRRLSG